MQLHHETNEEGENSTRQMSDTKNISDQMILKYLHDEEDIWSHRDDCDQTGWQD